MKDHDFGNDVTVHVDDDILATNSVRGVLDEYVPAGHRLTIFDVAHGEMDLAAFDRIMYPIYDEHGKLMLWARARIAAQYLEFTTYDMNDKSRAWLSQFMSIGDQALNWVVIGGPLGLVSKRSVWRNAITEYNSGRHQGAGEDFVRYFVYGRGHTPGSWPEMDSSFASWGLRYQITLLAAASHRIATWPVMGSTLDQVVRSVVTDRAPLAA